MYHEDSDHEVRQDHSLFEEDKQDVLHVLEDGSLENEDFPGSLLNSCASQAPIPHQPVSSLAVDCTHACYHDEDFELQDSFELHPPQVVAELHTETEGF